MSPRLGSVPTYGVVYFASIVVHFIIALALARRVGSRRWIAVAIGLCYFVTMIIGARVLHDVLHNLPVRFTDLFKGEYYERGGLWGGPLLHLALATAGIVLFARRRGPALDLVALSLPIPMGVIKIGCFCNGCCYGIATSLPWGVRFPAENPGCAPVGVPLHPVQLYETILMFAIMVVLIRLRSRLWQGRRLLLFLVMYGLGRGLLEFLRGDVAERTAVGPFALSQLICLGVASVAALILVLGKLRHPMARPLMQAAVEPPSQRLP